MSRLRYDDVFPFSPNDAAAMLQCNLDPRNANAPANKDLSLLPSYDELDANLNPYADPAAAQARVQPGSARGRDLVPT